MEESALLLSILQKHRSEMSELFGGRGTFIGCSVSSVFPALSLLFPALHCCPCPDGTRVNTSGGRPPVSQSVRVKSVSQRRREGASLCFVCPPPLSLSRSLFRHQLTSSIERGASLLSHSVRNRISQKEDKRRRRRLHFFSGGHWLPPSLPPSAPFLPSGFIYWLG